MRRVLAPVLPLLAAVLTLATAGAAQAGSDTTPRVVGGAPATTADAPWQVLVLPDGYLCGGAILDATHVVTAAHCLYDDEHQEIIAPSMVTVHAGITNRFAAGQHPTVSAVSVNPDYDPSRQTGDVAILTLATSFTLGSAVQAIPLTDVGYRPTAGDDLRLSGWGSNVARSPDDETEPHAVDDLNVVSLRTSTGCAAAYAPFDDNKLLCAGTAGKDACQGDSGGPLAVQVGGVWKLAGVVTGGAGCAWDHYPGYYARVADTDLHAYLAQRGAGYSVQDPVLVRAPSISGNPTPGGTLTCDLGTWQHAYNYGVGFVRGATLIARGPTLTLGVADAGTTVSCVVEAYGLTGTADALSAPVTVADLPAPTPTPPAPAVNPNLAAIPSTDAVAPTARIVKLSCTKRGVCVLEVRVTDPTPSAGVRGVEASVTTAYRATCVKQRKRRSCAKTVERRLKAVATGINTYKITTPRLRKGTQTFRLVASDLKGNRQARATTVRKTTR